MSPSDDAERRVFRAGGISYLRIPAQDPPVLRRFIAAALTALLLGLTTGAAVLAHSAHSRRSARSAPAGGPVPAGTTATSVSFISANAGFVLGTARCSHPPCSVILRTKNRGATWVGLPAPLERVSAPEGIGLWGLRFADTGRGYAYGDGIWQTVDGGETWKPLAVPGPFVVAFAAVRDRELVALTATCRPGSGSCPDRLTLYHRPIARAPWRPVAISGPHAFDAGIAVHRGAVWVLAGRSLFVSGDAGSTFTSHAQPCPRTGSSLPLPGSIADAGAHTYLLCVGQGFASHTVKYLYRTGGDRSGWRLVGRLPTPGDGGELAAGSDRALVLATSSAASWLYRSAQAGRHWRTALTEADGGLGWGDLGFTTARDGVVIHGPASRDGGGRLPGRVLLTGDGGRTWRSVRF